AANAGHDFLISVIPGWSRDRRMTASSLCWSGRGPREYLLTLFETASETVRQKFETADRGKADLVREMIKPFRQSYGTVRRSSPRPERTSSYCTKKGDLTKRKFANLRSSGSSPKRRRDCLC